MFYSPAPPVRRALVTLTPAESKRLIGKAVARLPEVQHAFQSGRIVIAKSSTGAYVAEELLGHPIDRNTYTSGAIQDGQLSVVEGSRAHRAYYLVNGALASADVHANDVLDEFQADDVYVKSANAVDPAGNAGVLLASDFGGAIGRACGYLVSRGSHLIVPVGLEKLIPSVIDAATECGQMKVDYFTGLAVGYMPLVSATVVTEREAIRLLYGLESTHVASGGINGSEGSVTISIRGDAEPVRAAFEEISQSIKGEPALAGAGEA